MLKNLACPISKLRGGMGLHYSTELTPYTHRLGVMAQKAEKVLLKINE